MAEIAQYLHEATITDCKLAQICNIVGTPSCPMKRGLVIASPLPPGEASVLKLPIRNHTRPFYEAVREAGLIRRDINGATNLTLAKDILLQKRNRQYMCDVVGGKRGHVYINPIRG